MSILGGELHQGELLACCLGCPAVGPFQLQVLRASEGCGGARCLRRASQNHLCTITGVVTTDVQLDTDGILLADKATALHPNRAAVLQSCCGFSWRWVLCALPQRSASLMDPQPPSQGISPGPQCSYTTFRIPGVPGVPSLPPSHPTSCLLGRITPA